MNKMKDFGGDPSEEGVACPTLLHQVVGGYTSPLIHQYQSKCDDGAGNSLRYCFEWLAPSNKNPPLRNISKVDPAPTTGCSKNE
jgi:hypothetical protein